MIRSARQIVNADLRPLNLSSAEGNILLHLLLQDQEIGQEQLAEQLDISKPAVSRALDSLEIKGFVTRQPDPDDRRMHRIRLTEQARKIGPAVVQAYNQLYALAMQGISQEELDYFVKLFHRISENFVRAQAKNKMEDQNAD
jgi:MarR family transcriptional regulator for hemolysin